LGWRHNKTHRNRFHLANWLFDQFYQASEDSETGHETSKHVYSTPRKDEERSRDNAYVRVDVTDKVAPGKENSSSNMPDIFVWFAKNKMKVMRDYSYTTGNCLFDSAAYLTPEWRGNGIGLRTSAISWAKHQLLVGKSEWTKNITAQFENSFHADETNGIATYQEYLTYMEDPSHYAATLDVYMLSTFLGSGIVIYSATGSLPTTFENNEVNFAPTRIFSEEKFERQINLFYDPRIEHYEPITSVAASSTIVVVSVAIVATRETFIYFFSYFSKFMRRHLLQVIESDSDDSSSDF